ncbi:hypothetical protein MA16_Dca011024 [Dendrobium catenatum]|uniref:Uncharacterized protein n=1 Tax=Dendrobium catenatum TaxID=906689 RepID=A0A2I0WCE9_9ASPA|nr:hypothetical protein MA16_Dca011024 [Dendrobium catenatum]
MGLGPAAWRRGGTLEPTVWAGRDWPCGRQLGGGKGWLAGVVVVEGVRPREGEGEGWSAVKEEREEGLEERGGPRTRTLPAVGGGTTPPSLRDLKQALSRTLTTDKQSVEKFSS